jgi:hypothetical protein
MPQDTGTISILGAEHALVLPQLFAIREEVASALVHGEEGQLRRALGAAILLCCPALLKRSRLDYTKASFSILNFGGAAYSWLREQGATLDEVITAGAASVRLCSEALSPRADEVAERAKVFPPPAAE